MKIWLDTIDFHLIADGVQRGVVFGITTNPSILFAEKSVLKTLEKLLAIQEGPVAAQIVSENVETMIEEGRLFSSLSPRVYVKVPITRNGLAAINQLQREGIPIMGTGVLYVSQALLAAHLNTAYMALYFSRIAGEAGDPFSTLKTIVDMYRTNRFQTKILVASIKQLDHLLYCASLGVDAVTIKADVYEALIADKPMVTNILQNFLKKI